MTIFPDFSFANAEVTLAASVTTGLEETAESEIREKLNLRDSDFIKIIRGRVYLKTSKEQLRFIHQLRAVDNLFLIIKTIEEYDYKNSKEKVETDLKKLASALPWFEVVQFWEFNSQFWKKEKRISSACEDSNNGNCNDIVSTSEENKRLSDLTLYDCFQKGSNDESLSCQNIPTTMSNGTVIRYRVSTNRVGKWQPVTSPEASWQFGGEIQDVTKWKVWQYGVVIFSSTTLWFYLCVCFLLQVDLSNYNLEILLALGEKSLEVALSLTLQSLHRR